MSTSRPSKTQAERSEATRAQLLRVARELFADPGYTKTSLDQVAERAGVTKGALYHHFANKQELFEAVFEQLEQELCSKVIDAAASAGADVWAGLRAGVTAFLEAARYAPCQRIVLIDGPTILGWERWKEIDERYGFGLTKASLEAAMDAGVLVRRPSDPIARLLLAALSEAAVQIARSHDPERTKDEMSEAVWTIIESLRA